MANIGQTAQHLSKVRFRTTITTVDPLQRIIEVVLPSGIKRLSVFDIPPSFVWPREGESWSVCYEGGNYTLGSKYLNPEEALALETSNTGESDLQPVVAGDLKLTARTSLQYGWIVADGTDVEIEQYPNLFEAIGYSQSGDVSPGEGIFTLPEPDAIAGFTWLIKT